MEIGKKIKTFRIAKSVTQEALAQELGVTAQAVSRWENGAAMPDIALLPALSTYFGVRIDDFFELSDEAQLERICNMTETEEFIPCADFDHAERYLKDRIALDPHDSESLTTLAALYNHRADGYHRRAENLCKRTLEVAPTEKAGHSLLSYAANGACFDWCSCNHRELIDYYYAFVEKNADFRPGYRWLLDNLIADLRLEEALDITQRIDRIKHDYYPVMMEGYVRSLLGEHDAAEAMFAKALEEEPENLYAWSLLGDIRVKQRRYDDAVACYERSAEIDPNPGFTDNYLSIAYIREMQGKWNDAADAYEKVLAVYRENKKLEDGYAVDQLEQSILRCRAKA
ncbi:MAG: tetratricopeptide repeat protein [Clostridia bacterium]|nr:tetratricopeptide repeat protein [Clostridia bacterium]